MTGLDTLDTDDRDRLSDLPPSAKLTMLTLATADEPLTQRDLRQRTLLHRNSARWALDQLLDAGLIRSIPAHDARQTRYAPNSCLLQPSK